MTFNELKELVYDIEDDDFLETLHFGCDCGCGGEYYTTEGWDNIVVTAEIARQKLRELGITFDEETSVDQSLLQGVLHAVL